MIKLKLKIFLPSTHYHFCITVPRHRVASGVSIVGVVWEGGGFYKYFSPNIVIPPFVAVIAIAASSLPSAFVI